VSASVNYEHKYIVIIDSLLNLHEHSGDTNGRMIVSNTSTLGL
jgi:hypothetical protein